MDGSLEAIPLTLRFLGELVGRTVRADVLALYAQNILAGLETMRAGLPAERRTVHIVGDAGRVDLPDPCGWPVSAKSTHTTSSQLT